MSRKPRKSAAKLDPGIAEVRSWRAKVWAEGGGTLKGVVAMLRAHQEAAAASGRVTVVRKKRAGKGRAKRRAA